ncbi:MAG: riboflavin synthase subunit alpha [Planctomycetes bacterium GWF2_41_51]|nr:MAG: riboflavin synthase subunit alpha [Planctomycetes bacterium GWF2_41_51]HBG27413.1 riboflavin synthase [Phycisphaerales bacterium]
MFTGLIESVCKVTSANVSAGGMKLQLNIGNEAKFGESIAVNGVCLTVSKMQGLSAEFDVSGETVSRTTLKGLKTGDFVNVERALPADGRLGGHIVQGHIDAVGKIKNIEKKGEFWKFIFEIPKESATDNVKDYLIPKGSIAIDGVSLTISEVQGCVFSTAIIPATFENTIFKKYKAGDLVNIETDILCRIVRKQLENILPGKSNLTIDKLKDLGF